MVVGMLYHVNEEEDHERTRSDALPVARVAVVAAVAGAALFSHLPRKGGGRAGTIANIAL